MTPAARRTREETRELVVEAALDLIRDTGLGVEPTTLSYQRVFAHLEQAKGVRITRASVHERIWDSQEDFQQEVLLRTGSWHTADDTLTLETAVEIHERLSDRPAMEQAREMTRVALPGRQGPPESDPLYYSWVGLTMSLARDAGLSESRRVEFAAEVEQIYGGTTQRVVSIVKALADLLGLRPRSDLFATNDDAWSLIGEAGLALSEGISVRNRLRTDTAPPLLLGTGPDQETQEWTILAAGYWALLNTFLEIDPDAHPDLAEDQSD